MIILKRVLGSTMKKLLALFVCLGGLPTVVNASVGCQSDLCSGNRHCTFEYVQCACPCRVIDSQRGKCLKCGHTGLPTRGAINDLQEMDLYYQ